ncbi:MAG: phenylalanine--tRNA ligase subunit alpha, partial [Bryobacteraceae bacterium]
MLEQQLSDLESAALARIHAARSPQDLEAVRIEVLGRKGALTQVSKDMGKLAPEDRARIGKLLNAAKQKLESAD